MRASYPAWSGRRTPMGGIEPVRSRRTTFSQVSAYADRLVRSSDSRLRSPVFRRSLWQVRQYCLRTAACWADGATADTCGAGTCADVVVARGAGVAPCGAAKGAL